MKDTPALQRHLGSSFVTAAFLHDFSCGVSSNLYMTVGMASAPAKPGKTRCGAMAALPLSAAVRAAQDICTGTYIAEEGDLESMLTKVRKQFDEVHDCDEQEEKEARDILEHVFERAAWTARETWSEVEAGFPVSGGDFQAWMEELPQRR